MKPTKVLQSVSDIIDERDGTHGDYREVFAMTAELWSAYLGMPISGVQVCALNSLQKIARDQCTEKFNKDNFFDVAGYAAIAVSLKGFTEV